VKQHQQLEEIEGNNDSSSNEDSDVDTATGTARSEFSGGDVCDLPLIMRRMALKEILTVKPGR